MKEQKGIWFTRSNNNRNYHICNGIVLCKRNGVHNRLKAKAKAEQTKWNIVFVRSFDSTKKNYLNWLSLCGTIFEMAVNGDRKKEMVRTYTHNNWPH